MPPTPPGPSSSAIPHATGRFGFGDHDAALGTYGHGAIRSVHAHSGENRGHHTWSEMLRNGLHHHVNSGSHTVHTRPLGELHRSASGYLEVKIAGRNEDGSGRESVTLLGFANMETTRRIQPFGK